jgi:hypothetical protein
MSLHRLAIFVNHKLGEVPLDETKVREIRNKINLLNECSLLSQSATLLVLEIFPQRSSFVSIDVDLFKQIEVCVVLHGKANNVLRAAWLLIKQITSQLIGQGKFASSKLGVQKHGIYMQKL